MKKLSILTILFFISSCASIFNSGNQTMLAHPTNPEDEGVVVNVNTSSGTYKAKLPATIISAPSTFSDVTVQVADKCYEKTEVVINKSVTPSYWVNIIIWPGLIIDALDGYMWKFDSQTIVPTSRIDGCKK
jgi:hypothetical protein